jgi:hypothetical protein
MAAMAALAGGANPSPMQRFASAPILAGASSPSSATGKVHVSIVHSTPRKVPTAEFGVQVDLLPAVVAPATVETGTDAPNDAERRDVETETAPAAETAHVAVGPEIDPGRFVESGTDALVLATVADAGTDAIAEAKPEGVETGTMWERRASVVAEMGTDAMDLRQTAEASTDAAKPEGIETGTMWERRASLVAETGSDAMDLKQTTEASTDAAKPEGIETGTMWERRGSLVAEMGTDAMDLKQTAEAGTDAIAEPKPVGVEAGTMWERRASLYGEIGVEAGGAPPSTTEAGTDAPEPKATTELGVNWERRASLVAEMGTDPLQVLTAESGVNWERRASLVADMGTGTDGIQNAPATAEVGIDAPAPRQTSEMAVNWERDASLICETGTDPVAPAVTQDSGTDAPARSQTADAAVNWERRASLVGEMGTDAPPAKETREVAIAVHRGSSSLLDEGVQTDAPPVKSIVHSQTSTAALHAGTAEMGTDAATPPSTREIGLSVQRGRSQMLESTMQTESNSTTDAAVNWERRGSLVSEKDTQSESVGATVRADVASQVSQANLVTVATATETEAVVPLSPTKRVSFSKPAMRDQDAQTTEDLILHYFLHKQQIEPDFAMDAEVANATGRISLGPRASAMVGHEDSGTSAMGPAPPRPLSVISKASRFQEWNRPLPHANRRSSMASTVYSSVSEYSSLSIAGATAYASVIASSGEPPVDPAQARWVSEIAPLLNGGWVNKFTRGGSGPAHARWFWINPASKTIMWASKRPEESSSARIGATFLFEPTDESRLRGSSDLLSQFFFFTCVCYRVD